MDAGPTAWSAYNAITGKDLLSGAHLSNGARIGYGIGVLASLAGMPAVAKALSKISGAAEWLKASKAGQFASKLTGFLKDLGNKVSESSVGKTLNKAAEKLMKPLNKVNDAYDKLAGKIQGLFSKEPAEEAASKTITEPKVGKENFGKGVGEDSNKNLENAKLEHLQQRANNIRSSLPTNKLQNRGNVAVADVKIDGLPSEFSAHSGIHALDSIGAENGKFSYAPAEDKRIFTSYIEDKFPRYNDTEAKILEDVASKIKDSNMAGNITLYTELPPCHSCTNIINEFREKFPNIKLSVINN